MSGWSETGPVGTPHRAFCFSVKNPNWVKKVRQPRRPRAPRAPDVIDYGYVVRAAPCRCGGHADIECYISDERPVGLSSLQKATFFTGIDQHGQDARAQAASYAYWQLGIVWFARRINGRIEALYEA